jgi:pseudaminic acid biosynthesis-associated methylase
MECIQDEQLANWQGKFGDAYVERNTALDIKQGKRAFSRIFSHAAAHSFLEVGCNIGNNLIYIDSLFGAAAEIHAIEPNAKAFSVLKRRCPFLKGAWNTSGYALPPEDNSIDLVFTSGVLIHIHPDRLRNMTDEIYRVSKKYILCSEYFSRDQVSISYRNHEDMLYKRDFGAHYLDSYPDLRCIDYGFLWERDFSVFDNLNWWLFEKTQVPAE